MIKLLFMGVLILFLNSCSSKQESLSQTQKHTLKSNELKLLMHNMSTVVYEKSKSVLDYDNTRRRYALTLASNIKKISYQIEQLSSDTFEQNMDKKDVRLFDKYTNELYKKGEDINKIALNYELEKLDSKLGDLKRTCNACHTKFRDN